MRASNLTSDARRNGRALGFCLCCGDPPATLPLPLGASSPLANQPHYNESHFPGLLLQTTSGHSPFTQECGFPHLGGGAAGSFISNVKGGGETLPSDRRGKCGRTARQMQERKITRGLKENHVCKGECKARALDREAMRNFASLTSSVRKKGEKRRGFELDYRVEVRGENNSIHILPSVSRKVTFPPSLGAF